MSAYYSQFDKEDLDDWQGKELIAEEEIGNEDFSPEPKEEDEEEFDFYDIFGVL